MRLPGGDAKSLYESCQRLLTLPDDTRVFVCHDYQPGAEISDSSRQSPSSGTITFMLGRHFGGFVRGHARGSGRGLEMPTLILPSLQVNMRAGNLPRPMPRAGFLKVPINAFGGTPLDRFASEE